MDDGLTALMTRIRACRLCVEAPHGAPLDHAPRPVIRARATARIAICGQAPGTRVHASGVPFTDPSGDRLRDWMGVSPVEFYDATRIAIVPMGFCFPGLDAKGGDKPPRRECAPEWRSKVFEHLPRIELMLLVGLYAQRWHLRDAAKPSLTETVASWREIASRPGSPMLIPLPHPSWRNNAWIKKHPWFEAELLPFVRQNVRRALLPE
jgi:uracil-DNA glycosylase